MIGVRASFGRGPLLSWARIGWALGALLSVAPASPAQEARASAKSPGLERILWVRGGPERGAKFYRGVAGLGFTAVNVSSGADPDLPGRYGLGYYLDQPGGKGVLELRDAQWEGPRDGYEKRRDARLLIRPSCLSDKTVTQRFAELVEERVRAAREAPPWAVALGDEISVTRHANPLDFCFGPACTEEFRRFLLRRHRDVETLNRAWGTTFSSFDEVTPLTTDQIRRRELGEALLPGNLRPWAEHREFMDGRLSRTVQELSRSVERLLPGVPCGLTGMQPPSAFGGHDYAGLMPSLTLHEAYDIGGARDLALSLAPPASRSLHTLFPVGEGEDRRLLRARLVDVLAHGASAVVAWSSAEALADDGTPTAYGRALRESFAALAAPSDAFAGARIERSQVWLVESQASVRAWWMLDSAADGMSWIRRLSSYEAAHSTSLAARASWVRLLQDLGYQPLLVPERQLSAKLRDSPPRVLVLPASIALSDRTVVAVRLFAGRGGVVVADHSPAIYDEYLTRREAPALDEMFGVQGRSLRGDALLVRQGVASPSARLSTGAAAAESGLRGELDEPTGKFHVFFERQVGRGRALYFNLAVCEYDSVRLDPARVATALDLRERVRHVLRGARVLPPVDVRGENLPTCIERLVLRGRDGRRLLAVRFDALDSPGLLGALAADGNERGEREVVLSFPDAVRLRRVGSQDLLGPERRFELLIDPFSGLFLEILPAR